MGSIIGEWGICGGFQRNLHQTPLSGLDSTYKGGDFGNRSIGLLFEVFNHYNTPDPIREGLFRMKDKDGKIGFADPKGNIVIQPQYAFACPFKNNRAKVTYSGERIPVGRNQEHWEWKSDYWFCIDREGNYVTDDPDVKTVKEYVESNAFIDIVPEKYYEKYRIWTIR